MVNVSAPLPAKTLQEVRDLWKGDQDHYFSAGHSESADGRVRAEVGYDYGSCGEAGKSWVSISENGRELRTYRVKQSNRLEHPVVSPDGDSVYVQQNKGDSYKVVELDTHGGGLFSKRTAFRLGRQPLSAITAKPDGKSLVLAQDNVLSVYDRRGGFLPWAKRFWNWQGNPREVGKLPEPARTVKCLSDGSVYVRPSYARRAYIVSPDFEKIRRVPLEELDPSGYRSEVRSHASWIPRDKIDAFVSDDDWLVTDEAEVKAHAAKPSPTNDRVAVVTTEDKQSKLWLWDVGSAKARPIADLPIEGDARNREVKWAQDGGFILVTQGVRGAGTEAIVADAASGRFWPLANVEGGKGIEISPDGQHVAAVSGRDGTLTLWDRAAGKTEVQPIDQKGRSMADASVKFTPDGKHAVVIARPAQLRQFEVHVRSLDGALHEVIPAVDSPSLDGATLRFRIGDQEQTVSLPEGLATLKEQPWYVNPSTGALFGGDGKDGLKVERGDEHVNVGGIVVPVRKPDAAGA
ncbi:MAG: WD40 repeat domain-containing protein [Armatimonadetes bacterium]|nr:WD40 repeat domain-containing protein [Armatimonadota bacterium]